MQQDKPVEKDRGKKRGNALGVFFFKFVLRLFGLRGAYALLYFVCVYYVIFDRPVFLSSLAYIKRRFPGCSFFKRYWHIYLLLVSQGKQLIDKYALISGAVKFNMELKGYKELKALLKDSSNGIILLTAHVGNWQMSMTALNRLGKKVYLVMRIEDNATTAEVLNINRDMSYVEVIRPGDDPSGIIDIMNKLKEGSIVSITGDRKYEFKSTNVSFLGDKASFPCGAFVIAAAVKCPVIILLSAKISTYNYMVSIKHVIHPSYQPGVKKEEQINKWVQQFALVLDEYVQNYPYQCFLFHDVWKDKDSQRGLES